MIPWYTKYWHHMVLISKFYFLKLLVLQLAAIIFVPIIFVLAYLFTDFSLIDSILFPIIYLIAFTYLSSAIFNYSHHSLMKLIFEYLHPLEI